MPGNHLQSKKIISQATVKKIRIGVVAGHFLTVMLVLTFSVVSEWLNQPEETITIQFYDPALDNIVENPSPAPDPNNPIPPSGTQDGGSEAAAEPEPPPPEPPKILQPDPVQAIAQPVVKQRTRPKPAINKVLPKVQTPRQAKSIKQPKVKSRKLPRQKSSRSDASDNNAANSNRQASQRPGSRGPQGSNSQPGHTAPGGQRGNSGYDIQIAMMIKRMWVTPDLQRLGGREPKVLIELRIAPNGMVTAKRIRTRSGVLAMDESIQNLLDQLYRVTPPYDGKSHTLIFWLKAQDH